MIVSSGETKIFEKKLKKGVTKQGGNCDSQWCRGDVFFRFFRKTTAQLGQILEITPVEDESFLKKKFRKGVTFLGYFCDSQ